MNDTSQIKNTQNNGTINNLNISRNSNVDEPFKSRNKFYQEYFRKFQNYTIKIKDKLHRNRKYELITLILSIIAIIFYIIGLQGCYGDEVYCLAKLGLFFYLKIIILNSISCICLCVALVLMTFRKASPLHLLYIIPIFLIMMMADQGTNLAHHGYFNTLGYIALLIIFIQFQALYI